MIPARGGSKRIPNKNIKILDGKPCIQYTIECAKEAGISRIIVSTDSPQIAEIAKRFGAEIPFLRPAELSGDRVLDFPVVEHCLDFLEEHENWVPDLFIFLRPTMPMRKSSEITKCLEILELNSAVDCVRTTCPVPYPPYWMKRINEEGLLEPFCEDMRPYQYTRSQDLPETIMCDGYVDVCRVAAIRKYRQIVAGNILACHQKDRNFVDLDEDKDWLYAEYLMKNK
jgi:CMP-N,N'-diacetyllegionaminic acid synthase